jgi:hypothetical protein
MKSRHEKKSTESSIRHANPPLKNAATVKENKNGPMS